MCGICGVFNFGRDRVVQRSWLEDMNRQIVHRGPDDDGFYVSKNIGLGMRRLSIIDLATGHQPLSNEDGTVWIVFNGEIYNYKDLRVRLEERGHSLRTHSDTETIVHLYEEYGPDCVQHLRGMFAFAIWDEGRRRLFLARDRLGIKPLYYRSSDRELVFGSEIKTLLQFPGVHAELNSGAIPEYLAFGYLSGTDTFFAGIHSLPPGCSLEVDESGKISVRQYWDLQATPDDEKPRRYYVEKYRDLLESCVSSHLMSDVPLGIFLSGGLDSSAVAAIAARLRREPIDMFSVGYEELPFSELPYAQAVAEHIGSKHHEVRVTCDDFFAALPRLIWHEDKPITWPSSVALYFVAQLAGKHVKVVLTGEGSDETLGGYSRYAFTLWNWRFHSAYRHLAAAGLRRRIRRLIDDSPVLGARLRRKLQHTFLGRDGEAWESFYFDNFLCAFSLQEEQQLLAMPVDRESVYSNSLRYWNQSPGDILSRLLYTDIKTYLVELLMKQDRMSMAASIESRVPFLDHVLVEFAASVPPALKTHRFEGKCILKAAVEDLLPHSIIYRRKMGFPTPWRAWLDGQRFSWIERLLTEPRSVGRGLFRPEAMRRLLHEHRGGHRDHTDRLWRLMNLELWCRVFLDGEHRVVTEPSAGARSVSG